MAVLILAHGFARAAQTSTPPSSSQDAASHSAPTETSSQASLAQQDLTATSIEDLMDIKVTSASKTQQSLSRTPAAMFVISRDDIVRSGANNIPDILRMVPGLDVAQINSSAWAVSARGFNSRFSNELLVLVDGRPVYEPVYGGVFWDSLDLPFEDIERIEVIRGPGGAIWGANAVNGVINIITKKVSEARSGFVSAGAGNVERGVETFQFEGPIGRTDARIYTKFSDQSALPNSDGTPGQDGWQTVRTGFRVDSTIKPKDELTISGDAYGSQENSFEPVFPSITSPTPEFAETATNPDGGFLQSSWKHTTSERFDSTLEISYEYNHRNDVLEVLENTLYGDFRQRLLIGSRHELLWGIDYRYSNSDSRGSLAASLNPPNTHSSLFEPFIQDEFALIPQRLYLTGGVKLEENLRYSARDQDLSPTARLAWLPKPHQTYWAAISRTVRLPAVVDTSLTNYFEGFAGPGGIPVVVAFIGTPRVHPEYDVSYEAGYRATLRNRFSLDIAAYYNDYTSQETTEPQPPFLQNSPSPPHFVYPETFENLMHGETHGFEIFGTWKVSDRWTLNPEYAFEQIHMHLAPTSHDTMSVPQAEGASPVHSAGLRLQFVFSPQLTWNTSAYFVDRLADPVIPAYTRLDTGLNWHIAERVSFGVFGQNLIHDHVEFVDLNGFAETNVIKHGADAKFTFIF
ncbi:MAG TPA: TonB-dependent receptor [Candidatus Acidoferrales bacterium]|nr:TonB-dependent receptor [Candidatus Acidoferrales bacterium]